MLKVKVLNFSDIILEEDFSTVNFFSFDEGFIGIHKDHEKMKFKLVPSKIILKKDEQEVVLYSGFGFASVIENIVSIVGYPVSESKDKFELICNQLNNYGKKCIKEFC
ncbi:hypothetical protein [Alphaproteobacteria bacterium endosymbiont of Tiliacea citrago]|uniref:hypothetical protein n=1 Tax=Alphaproteobacteria bacterium endosymbiont of Tiliacea citrago TaxID=3077944 RepID=UPI00313AFB81